MDIAHATRSYLCCGLPYMDYVMKNAFDAINSAVNLITIRDQ